MPFILCASKQKQSVVFFKKTVLKNFTKLGRELCWSRFINKTVTYRPAISFKRQSSAGVFLWILRAIFLWEPVKLLCGPTQPTFQRRVNIVSMLWLKVELTLIRRWKWNKIKRRIFNIIQLWYNVGVWLWNNVETTLIQSVFDLNLLKRTWLQRW